ncbi:hypothetical protein MXB_4800 [Myxobolus squamalis]|nr:hypothetical protein MXB_4800 [Myxobolus squamalis]
MNGSSYSNMPHGYPPPFPESCHYPMGIPPYGRHHPMHPQFDPMMMPRNNAHLPPPYGQPLHSYQMPSPLPPNSYSSYVGDTSYINGNANSGGPKVPKSFYAVSSLQHTDVVCAVSFSSPFNYIYTGCKGMVKIWDVADVASPKLLSSIDCLKESYVRACKSINENKLLVVAGEHPSVGIWSLTPNNNGGLSVNIVCELVNPAPVCYNMAITSDEKQCYCCCGNGVIVGWDIETARIIRSYTGHIDGATSIDISPDGSTIWTGGLDATARCWDARDGKQSHVFSFPTQVFSLCIAPTSDYIVVGLENKTVELCYLKESVSRFGERHVFKVHDSCVLTVKIANSGKWMVSSSKDNYTNCVKLPQGSPIFITRETASIICTEISPDDKYFITGGGEKKATIYECIYP